MRISTLRLRIAATALLTVLGLAVHRSPALAQDGSGAARPPITLPGTELRTLRAAANGIDYRLYVSLPPGYRADGPPLPVMYLLDADYSFAIARNIAEHLIERSHLPPVVLVAIAYEPDGRDGYRFNRTRDYTPIHSPTGGYGETYQTVSGGAPKFLAFIRDELIPWVAREYRVSDDRTIVGHSYGGLFVLWATLQEPRLFRRAISVSPSIWYADRMLLEVEEAFAARGRSLPLRFFMGVGSREVNSERDMVVDLERYAARLRGRRYEGLALQSRVMQDETHNSVFPIAFTKGLRWIYQDHGAR